MIRSQYALCANRVIRDADENRISVIDLLDYMTVASFPIVLPRLSLIWALSRDEGDAEKYQAVVVLRLNEQTLLRTELEVNFQGSLSTRVTAVIGGLVLPAPGQFMANWSIENHLEASYAVVIQAQPHVANTESNAGGIGMIS